MCYNEYGDNMYEYIKGIVTEVESTYIVVETAGIGYLVYVPNPYSFSIDKEAKVYVYQQVREDELSLYGFHTLEEKQLFLKLINVKGLGCKMALPILATGSIEGIMDAIERENILYLKKFPKIGDKVAKQIILDLKGKLGVTSTTSMEQNFEELIEVLEGLGYKNNDIKKVLPQVHSDSAIEEQIKEALKLLLK